MAEAEDLKSSQCGFDPHSGHNFVRKSSHLSVHNSSIWINNAYTNAYTLPEDFKAMGWYSDSFRANPSALEHSSRSYCLCHWAIRSMQTPQCEILRLRVMY